MVYIYIYIMVKGLAEVINKLFFNNLHNPPPTKYFDTIIKPLCSKQLLNLVLVEDTNVKYNIYVYYMLFSYQTGYIM